jgi:hypothetical protein
MAANSTQSEMEILELPDDDLLNIFAYLDQKSLNNAMLVCRRFESLIDQTHELYKNRKLVIHRKKVHMKSRKRRREDSDKVQTECEAPSPKSSMKFRRSYGEVEVQDYHFSPNSKYFPSLLETMESIGSKIIKLKLNSGQWYKDPFLDVMRLASNVKELIIERAIINEQMKNLRYKKMEPHLDLPLLKSLEITDFYNFGFVQQTFNKIDSLQHLKI